MIAVAALTYAFGGLYGKKFKALPPIETATGQITAATAIMLPLSLWIDRPWTLAMPDWQVWAALFAIALISTALAYILFYRLIATAPVTSISLVTFLLPINALWLGAAFLGERVTLQATLGMALIGAGLAAIDGRLLFGESEKLSNTLTMAGSTRPSMLQRFQFSRQILPIGIVLLDEIDFPGPFPAL